MHKYQKAPLNKVAEQTDNNSTGWVGQVPGIKDHMVMGQTFIAGAAGDLQAIEVFSNVVTRDSHVLITLYNFDTGKQCWGQVLGTASIEVKKADAGKWLVFNLPGLHLAEGQAYGFRLDSMDSYIGVGEACGSFRQPVFKTGQEWQFTDSNPNGNPFTYFSLAFRVEVAA